MEVEVLRQWTVSENSLDQVEHFEVEVRGTTGGLLQFNVIKVEGS